MVTWKHEHCQTMMVEQELLQAIQYLAPNTSTHLDDQGVNYETRHSEGLCMVRDVGVYFLRDNLYSRPAVSVGR